MNNEEWDRFAQEERERTRRLRAETIAEFEAALVSETSPYEREHLRRDLEQLRGIAER